MHTYDIKSFLWKVLLCNIIFLLLYTTQGSSDEPQLHNQRFSLESNNEPLQTVLLRITKATGQVITTNKEAETLRVTVKLENVTALEGIKVIMHAIAAKGYTLDVSNSNISIAILTDQDNSPPIARSASLTNSSEMEVTPPDLPGEKGITVAEAHVSSAEVQDSDPLNMEVTPPDAPGEKGITLHDIHVSTIEQETSPSEMEITPPDTPDGKGVTVAEVQNGLATSLLGNATTTPQE